MKIFSFGGGLGNQIFEYIFYLYMKNKYPNHKMYGHYNSKRLSEHYGLEIDKWFKIQLPKSTWYSTMIVLFLVLIKRIIKRNPFVDASQRECKNENAIVFLAFKYTKLYFPKNEHWLIWNINEDELSPENKDILCQIRETNSWFIHVRRGDFLSKKYKKKYEGCCPLSYYQQAIAEIMTKEDNPTFFGFSDDIDWAKKNLPPVNIKFIDWNNGRNSPIDMFLMSQCKGAIIANSTFSYWGAVLGYKKKQIYYPQKWMTNQNSTPDIFFNNWIKL